MAYPEGFSGCPETPMSYDICYSIQGSNYVHQLPDSSHTRSAKEPKLRGSPSTVTATAPWWHITCVRTTWNTTSGHSLRCSSPRSSISLRILHLVHHLQPCVQLSYVSSAKHYFIFIYHLAMDINNLFI